MRAALLLFCALTALLLSACVAGLDGRLILDDADRREAVRRYQAHLDEKPDDWTVRRRLGLAQFELKEYVQAEASFLDVQERAPGEPVTLFYLGLARIGKGEREAALAQLMAYRWPGKFYHQKYVREEAQRLARHPEATPGEAIASLLLALEEGRRVEREVERDRIRD